MKILGICGNPRGQNALWILEEVLKGVKQLALKANIVKLRYDLRRICRYHK